LGAANNVSSNTPSRKVIKWDDNESMINHIYELRKWNQTKSRFSQWCIQKKMLDQQRSTRWKNAFNMLHSTTWTMVYSTVLNGNDAWRLSVPCNRPFPSCLAPLFQSESWCTVLHTKISFDSHANKTHFQVVHSPSRWRRGARKLGNGLLASLRMRGPVENGSWKRKKSSHSLTVHESLWEFKRVRGQTRLGGAGGGRAII